MLLLLLLLLDVVGGVADVACFSFESGGHVGDAVACVVFVVGAGSGGGGGDVVVDS